MAAPTHTPVDLTDEQRANLAKLAAAHTPGPWRAVGDISHFGTLSTVIGGEQTSIWPNRQLIAQVGGSAGVVEQEANARLIAAAPDLLAALLQIDGEASAKEPSDRRTVGFDHLLDEADFANDLADEAFQDGLIRGIWLAAQIARDAIAKATGYSSAIAALNDETNEMVALSNGRLG